VWLVSERYVFVLWVPSPWPLLPWQLKMRLSEMARRDVPNEMLVAFAGGLAAVVLWKALEGLVG
jgi:hypothetical protein